MSGEQVSWESSTEHLADLGQAVAALLRSMLATAGIANTISVRVKTRESAEGKLDRHPEKYNSFSDLQDLLGVRVTTYFSDDVDRIADLFAAEFEIDSMNSVDKRKLLEPDRFGYLSLHFVASMSKARTEFLEYKEFKNKVFELQIRSVLQHAWAEIEHDLGYKVQAAVPPPVRRRFSRLAGLLELADDEFASLRRDLLAYETTSSKAVIEENPTVDVDQSTLTAFVETNRLVLSIDQDISSIWGAELAESVNSRYIGARAAELTTLGVTSMSELRARIAAEQGRINEFARKWLEGAPARNRPIERGISVFYLVLLLVSSKTAEEVGLSAALSPFTQILELLKEKVEGLT